MRIGPQRDRFVDAIRALRGRMGLLEAFTRREIRVRYKQSLLGVAWALIYPISLMTIFTLVFSRVVGLRGDGHPYPLFSYVALLPWTFLATGTTLATRSLVTNVELVTKVWFPREVLPIGSVLASLFDFAIAAVLLLGLLVVWGQPPTLAALWVVPLIVVQLTLTMGVALFTSAVNVRYRDVKFIVPLVLQVWLYASPVIYSLTLVPERFRAWYALNPMVGLIDGYRGAFLDGRAPDPQLLGQSAVVSVLALVFGWWYFHRVEVHFADVI